MAGFAKNVLGHSRGLLADVLAASLRVKYGLKADTL